MTSKVDLSFLFLRTKQNKWKKIGERGGKKYRNSEVFENMELLFNLKPPE